MIHDVLMKSEIDNKTPDQVKDDFARSGQTIRNWAKSNGFAEALVYRVLNSHRIPRRGKSHEIAVKLGIKSEPGSGKAQ